MNFDISALLRLAVLRVERSTVAANGIFIAVMSRITL